MRNQSFPVYALASVLLATGLLVGCADMSERSAAAPESGQTADSAKAAYEGPKEENSRSTPAPATLASVTRPQRSVIRQANLSVRVAEVEKAEREATKIAARAGGFFDSANATDLASAKPTMQISLRVPVEAFERVLGELEGLGTRMSKTVSTDDVTGQIVDLDARLKSLAAQEQTYRDILGRARTVGQVLEVQRVLGEVRAEIESMAAQRKSVAGLAALSTISLTLEQEAVVSGPAADPQWLQQTWGEATTAMGDLLRKLAALLIWLLVLSPIWGPVVWLVGRAVRHAAPRGRPSPAEG